MWMRRRVCWGSMARVIERADQLVLEYVSKVADAAHGVLRTDQRLDFVGRLRARIEDERRGSEDPATVRKVIARFGDPGALLQREIQRLAAPVARPPARDDYGDSATEVFSAVADDMPDPAPPRPPRPPRPVPLPRGAGPAARRPVTGAGSGPLTARLRQAAVAGVNSRAADGRDAATVLRNDRREVAGIALLTLAALLIPFPLPYLAIFPFPVLVWAVGALTVLAGEAWVFKDRLTGIAAPIAAYVFGGALLAVLQAPEAEGEGVVALANAFWHVSGLMFMLGSAGGVLWLGYRLFNPPPPPPRRQPLGTVR